MSKFKCNGDQYRFFEGIWYVNRECFSIRKIELSIITQIIDKRVKEHKSTSVFKSLEWDREHWYVNLQWIEERDQIYAQ